MKLDNRPRTLIVKGLPETDEAKGNAKAWFASFPECESVGVNESTGELEVKYKNRFAADQAFASGATIPAIGTLQFAWPSAATSGVGSTAPAKKSPISEPAALDNDIGMRTDSNVEDDGWGASGGWDDDDEGGGGGRRDRM